MQPHISPATNHRGVAEVGNSCLGRLPRQLLPGGSSTMADTMVVEGDDTVDEGMRMRRSEDQGSLTGSKRKAHNVLDSKDVKEFIAGRPSDVEGLKQLLFHIGVALAAAWCVKYARLSDSWLALMAAEVFLGFVASFYFTGFHEMIHNTAFATRSLNKILAHIVGFFIFRGANWYWYFHWYHHRFTNDPERDPELSGTTVPTPLSVYCDERTHKFLQVDRADPTRMAGKMQRLGSFAVFLSGYPFGFERLLGIGRHALGAHLQYAVPMMLLSA